VTPVAIGVALLLLAATSCAPTESTSSTQTVQPTPASSVPPSTAPTLTAPPTTAATISLPARPLSFATICGTISEYVSDGAQTDGSFILNSPGRAPLALTIPAGRLGGGGAGGYVCVGVQAGTPHPLFDGFAPSGTPGFVDTGKVPATAAQPTPTGFVLPQACAFVATPVVGTDQIEWSVDCGAANNNNARGILGPALAQQTWTSCASGLATAQWRKDGVMLGVVESSLAPGEYMRVIQFARLISPCI
jgi:hypothetical protein